MTESPLDIRLYDIGSYAKTMLEILEARGIDSHEKLARAAKKEGLGDKVHGQDNHYFLIGDNISMGDTRAIGIHYSILSATPLAIISANISQNPTNSRGRINFVCKEHQVEGYESSPHGKIFRHTRSLPICDFSKLIEEIRNLRGCQ
jgi:hypothetical protein